MSLAKLTPAGGVMFSLPLLAGTPLVAQPNADRSSGPVWTVHAGRGGFARILDVETGSSSINVPVVGASIELPVGGRVLLGLSAGFGALLGETPGGSTSSGTVLDASALWLLTPARSNWGVSAGPGVTHTRLGKARTGVGGVASAGVRRGIGPRLTVRSRAMSSPERGMATRVELGVLLTR